MASGKRKRDSIHETPDVSYITNPDVAHEHTDVPVTPVLKFVGALVIFAIVIHIAMWAAFKFFESREIAAERQSSPLARTKLESLPPEPRLQLAPGFGVTTPHGERVDLSYEGRTREGRIPAPQSEYLEVLKEWQNELKEYGWADQKAGTVRVPIDEAIKRYAQQVAQKTANSPGTGSSTERSAPAQSATPAPTATSSGPHAH